MWTQSTINHIDPIGFELAPEVSDWKLKVLIINYILYVNCSLYKSKYYYKYKIKCTITALNNHGKYNIKHRFFFKL